MVIWITYPKIIVRHSKTLQISTRENQGSKISVDGLEERLCGGKMQVSSSDAALSSVAVDPHLLELEHRS